MIDQIVHIDQEIFLAINQGLSNPVFDWLLPILRNPYTWAPLYLFLVIFFIKTYGKTGILIVVMTLATFGASDAVSSHLIKKSVKRVRPCNDIVFKEEVNIRVRCGSGFSFTSSHATNHFALAFFWIALFRRKWKHAMWLCITWATLISVSQIYVGVHYPFDILCGAILGILIGMATGYIFKKLKPEFFNPVIAK
ncbi:MULTISPECIES: phosphatase PAP2 family protein [Sphingobacterium]|uniref:Phosphatase PAP2 family protein n=2 Tax=Sphingobacterium TaxID=28453 RepID=A0ABW5YXQ4_9SPHI|nr:MULTISPECIES: phosphatase PAP2 family protein [Sphingobacterium]KKX51846.1 phospholipid phosphatase [Sphingobacterium sp. IITKGP-BTPF85]MBB2949678.1 undecaprenyl-diphosphatase [Sphingobacterium sp. JUb56]MCS3556117.1 undecaprenyl-diphosphatase [Sphingobacterium sp. JUb21]MCW2263549.1 undecaprenyl-diphosphatase [Sphingobacterium kitahiroshimense]NJI74391.1 phosphatase PAP2 family protein [Sphingobacterium sp. B16(2022)]